MTSSEEICKSCGVKFTDIKFSVPESGRKKDGPLCPPCELDSLTDNLFDAFIDFVEEGLKEAAKEEEEGEDTSE